MSTPTYLAVKVGDEYELRRIDPEHQMKQAATAAAGALLSAFGFTRKSMFGTGIGLIGAAIVYHGLSGRNPIQDLKNVACRPRFGIGPSYHHEDKSRSAQSPADSVDEASMESFPASDSPAIHKDENPSEPFNPAA